MIKDVFVDMCQREIKALCFEQRINSIPIYNYIKREIRSKELERYGFSQNFGGSRVYFKKLPVSFFRSLLQISKLIFSHKEYKNLIYSFNRVDKINGVYLDKFTDPLIDYSTIKDSFIIFDRGNGGNHNKPRLHQEHVVYTDSIKVLCSAFAYLYSLYINVRYKKDLMSLWKSIDAAYPHIHYIKRKSIKTISYMYLLTRVYGFLLKKMGVRYLYAPARSTFLHIIPAAIGNNITVLELQHGVTYSESLTYSGYRDIMFTPTFFLSFGEMNPKDVYGIDENKIINIGWAFGDYVNENVLSKNVHENAVLVISEPHITDKLLKVTQYLAYDNPEKEFYFRPHPLEHLGKEVLDIIEKVDNIHLDDNTQSVLSTLRSFNYVIGENSTVLYEALSLRKKVAKIQMEGLEPVYLQDGDRTLFWVISDCQSFKSFWNANLDLQHNKSIYSDFNKTLFESIINN